MQSLIAFGFLLMLSPCLSAPVDQPPPDKAEANEETSKTDLPVEQLEKLKLAEGGNDKPLLGAADGSTKHVEFHSIDSVKSNGELVSRLEQHATADSVPGEKPQVHGHLQLDVPAEGVHKEVLQNGEHVSVIEGTAPTTTLTNDEQTTKVFHGAARLIQAGSGTNVPQNTHTAVRRAYNPDLAREINADRTSVQYSPLDMAEYVFWTGDERGVTTAVEEFLQEGTMTKEEAITFLQEIKFNIDYLRAHYTQNMRAAEETAQQEKMRNMLIDQSKDAYQYRPPLQSYPFISSQEMARAVNKNWDLSSALNAVPIMPIANEIRQEPSKRSYPDAMLQTNILSTSDYDRDSSPISEEEYEEMMDKLKAADSLYTEYTLEEIIYQLAKMMFSQSLNRDPREARAAIQRFMTFLELEAERGQLSRSIEKKVLDLMVAALTDTVGDHPELLQARENLALNSGNRLVRQFLETSVSEPSMSRAILAAYKDELLRGPALHKPIFSDRN